MDKIGKEKDYPEDTAYNISRCAILYQTAESENIHVLASSLVNSDRTRYHRLGGLNNRHLPLKALEAEKSKMKVQADWILGEGSPLAAPTVPIHCRGSSGIPASPYKSTNPIRGLHSWDCI